MAIVITDASSGLYNWLKTDAAAASLRALVYNGAENVLEEGDLTPEMLANSAVARHAAGQRSKVLAVTIHDDGEKGGISNVSVRIYDRQEGYRNIRTFRDLLLSVFENAEEITAFTLQKVNGERRGLLFLEYAGRTGHVRVRDFACDMEAIAFSGKLLVQD